MKTVKFTALAALLIVIAVIFGDYSINTQAYESERVKIAFVFKTTKINQIEFWNTITDGIKAASDEFHVDYEILGALEESDVHGNISAVMDAIAMNPDAIVLTAADYVLLEPYAKKVSDAGILLMTMDSDAAGGYSRCFVATDNILLGKKMGEEMAKRAKPGGKIGIVGHIRGTATGIERVSGALQELDSRGFTALEPVYCDNNADRAKKQAIQIIGQNPDLAGIAATNEVSAHGVAMAVDELGLQDKIIVVTCDNSSRQITYLEQGIIDATISQRPFNMGYKSVQIATDLLKNKNNPNIPAFFDTGCEVVTRENMFSPENQKLLFPFRG